MGAVFAGASPVLSTMTLDEQLKQQRLIEQDLCITCEKKFEQWHTAEVCLCMICFTKARIVLDDYAKEIKP